MIKKKNGAVSRKTNGVLKKNDNLPIKANGAMKTKDNIPKKANGVMKKNGLFSKNTNGVEKSNGIKIKTRNGEIWKQILFPGHKKLRKKYAVSNEGRAASYSDDVYEDGKILSGSLTSGYRTLNLHLEDGNGTIYLHREVARLFCPRKSPKFKFVIHNNHVKTDNRFKNLQWATAEEVSSHQQSSPEKIAYKERQANRTEGLKLNAAQVRKIKKEIANPKRKLTYKQMAEKYGVSEMTLYRIKSGENWSRVN